jgi:hypothetical protein
VFDLKYTLAALAAALSVTAFSAPAAATHRRCGYDPYGYHAPNFWGCYRRGWGFYPAYGFYPEGSYYATPRYPVYPVPPPAYPVYTTSYCYFDNGYDMRPHRICVPAW